MIQTGTLQWQKNGIYIIKIIHNILETDGYKLLYSHFDETHKDSDSFRFQFDTQNPTIKLAKYS